MFNKKGLLPNLFRYIIVAAVLYAVGSARLFGVAPFSAGLYIALVFLGINIFALSGIYVSSALLCDMSIDSLIGAAVVCGVMLIARAIEYKSKKKMGAGFIVIPALIGQSGFLYIRAAAQDNLTAIFLSVFFMIMFMYVCICFFRPVIVSSLKYRLLDYEIICGCVFLIVLSLGLGYINIYGFKIISFASLIGMCMFSYAGGSRAALISGVCFGIGCALVNNDIAMMACFPFAAMLICVFSSAPRILSSASGILGYIMFVFYFNTDYSDSAMFIIGMSAGGVVFVLLPKKLLDGMRSFFSGSFSRTALRYVVNHNRYELGGALMKVSDIFYEMSGLMSGLRSEISDKNTEILCDSVSNDFCTKCAKKALCSGSRTMKDALIETIKISVSKGRATVVDLPQAITENCIKIAQLITFVSEISAQYNKYIKTLENENAAKRIVSEQLLGVSGILKDMGVKEAAPLSFDLDKERLIMEELTYRNIICSEALVSLTDRGGRVTLIVLSDNADKPLIEKTLGKILRKNYTVTAIEDSVISGWSVVHAEASPRYDVVFGFASCPKAPGESSGDTHSFIKIHNNKFMMALCDGMGSGHAARRFSDATISLIENFYKAGFEHNLVLESVNKFLSLSGEENFSAVDVCVVDLETAEADVIKIGSPASYIKNSDSVTRLDGSALPIGMLDEMRPSVSTQRLSGGDMVILTTDGVSDSFSGDDLASLINNLSNKNPQQLCSKIAETSINKTGVPCDDMTVAAFRIFKRVS